MTDKPTVLERKPRCSNCKFFVPSVVIGDARCRWTPPPAVQRLYIALTQEPNLKINYEQVNATLPEAMSPGPCSEHVPREDA